LVCCFTII